MSFLETPRFPDEIAAWAVGGRGFMTTVVETYGGNEYRNAAWSQARGKWEVLQDAVRMGNPSSPRSMQALRTLFRVCAGQLYGFRFKDYQDYQDEAGGVLGTTGLAVGSTLAYQMFKDYVLSPLSYQQIIQKPVASTIAVYNNGVLQTTPGQYSLDSTTGIVTFVSQPTVGHTLTWTGEFDVPVRFATDDPRLGLEPQTGAVWEWQQLTLIEIRNP